MQFKSFLVVLPVAVSAIQVTYPTNTTTWKTGSDETVKFSTVSTDDKTVNILLVNMAVNPSVSETVGTDVDTSSGSYTIKASDLSSLSSGTGYQINLVSTSNNGILAQSDDFTIEKGTSSSSTGSSSATGTATSAAATDSSSAAATGSTSSTTGTATTLLTSVAASSTPFSNSTSTATGTAASASGSSSSTSSSSSANASSSSTTKSGAASVKAGVFGAAALVAAGVAALL